MNIRDNHSILLPAATIAGTRYGASNWEAGNAIHDASTGEVIGWQEHADAAQIDAAVRAARAALDAWRNRTPAARGEVLRKIAELLAASRASASTFLS